MFGYVRIRRAELLVREDGYYQALYCGLCHAQGKCTGHCSRLTLSYDFVFMAALRLAIAGERPTFVRGTCPAHPFRKRLYAKAEGQLPLTADCAGLLCALKARDDCADERGRRKWRAVAARGVTRRAYRLASGRHPELAERVSSLLGEIAAAESDPDVSLDTHADLCGQLLAAVFSEGLTGKNAKLCANVGYHLGKLVDMLDAADDWREDAKKGRFNPLSAMYPTVTPGDEHVLANAEVAMQGELLAVQELLDLVDFDGRKDLEHIVQNVVYYGIPDAVTRVLHPEQKEEKTNEVTL